MTVPPWPCLSTKGSDAAISSGCEPWRLALAGGYDEGMDANPYESPSPAAAQPNRLLVVLLRFAAIGFWMASLVPVLMFVLMVGHPENFERADNPLLHVPSAVVVFALPALGFLLLGVASWWRVKEFAIMGLTSFVPIAVISLIALMQP